MPDRTSLLFVTSEAGGAKLAHISTASNRTLCRVVFTTLTRIADDVHYDRHACPRCVDAALVAGHITPAEAARLLAHRPTSRNEPMIVLLRQGKKDEVVARTLKISLRTLTRRVRDEMREVGARTRFQFGYLIAERDFGQRPTDTGYAAGSPA